jgi:hypothetical protein
MRGACTFGRCLRPNREARYSRASHNTEGFAMLETVAIILVVLWLLGMVSSYTLSGFIHILLVLAIIVVLIRVIGGRSAL